MLPSYAVMAFLGGFVILVYLYFRFERYDLTFQQFIKLFAFCAFTCFLGSKIVYFLVAVLIAKDSISIDGMVLLFLQSGYVFYGGLSGVLLGIWLFSKRANLDPRSLYQMTAPAFPLFHGFGRIGCMLAGCCYGTPLNPPIVLFDTLQVNLFPTQLIEALYEFVLFFVLCFAERSGKEINLLRLYLLGYAIFRFGIEFYRADADRGIWMGFSTAQWISVVIVLFFIGKYLFAQWNCAKPSSLSIHFSKRR